ncbi:unnamed protein product [Rhizophagus irregularis]|uniref:Uncharacterized protein n=1 Tax=Rhizophagus irregularis TaxID=588596 RepID=A0A916DZW2_9GLOM|nr:unnamed protein product [Rhizophagus irregularis]CAB5326922.1 unnamed protein product [Rhizophagus irregularis]
MTAIDIKTIIIKDTISLRGQSPDDTLKSMRGITREDLTSPGGGAQRHLPKVKDSYIKLFTVRKRRRIFLAPFKSLSRINRQFLHLKVLEPPSLSLTIPQFPQVLLVYSSEHIMTLQWGYSLAL